MALITNQEIQSMIDDIAPGKIIKSDHIKKLAQKLKDQRQVHTGTELPDASEYEKGDLFYVEGSSKLYIKDFENWSIIQADPYSSMVVDDFRSSNKVYRIFMHPDGNDLNDGLSWDTPIKSLVCLAEILPKNLNGYKAYVLFHPGAYDLDTKAEIKMFNGELFFQWVGSYFNTATSAFAEFVRAGKTNPITSDEQVILTTTTMDDILFYLSGNNDLTFWFGADDWSYNVSEANHGFHNKFVFKANETVAMNGIFILENLTYFHYCGGTLDLQKAKNGIVFWGNIKGNDNLLKIIGGTGTASTSTSFWNSVYYISSDEFNVNISKFTVGFVSGYEPTKYVEIENITRLFNIQPYSIGEGFAFNILTADVLLTGSQPKIYLGEKADKFSISYDSDNFVLDSASKKSGVVKQYSSGILQQTKNYLSDKIKSSGDNTIFKVSTAVPSDDVLVNQDVVFYIDEATDTLKVKYKDSTGAIFTGNLSLTAS